MTIRPRVAAIALPVLLSTPLAFAAEEAGGLLGWVEDTHGSPLAGAVISVFGKGVGTEGLITLSDSTGRFFLRSLPAGSYTLRALRAGHEPSPARQVVVQPDHDYRFTVSLRPVAEPPAAEAAMAAEPAAAGAADARRELTWLLRHKQRSVLESRDPAPPAEGDAVPRMASLAPWLPALGAALELVTSPETVGLGDELTAGDGVPASLSLLRLQGRLSDSGRWSLGGLLAESGTTSWRMAAEFVMTAGDHEIHAGSGFGNRLLRSSAALAEGRDDDRVGAVFLEDRWQASEALVATIGARYSHLGFLKRANFVDPRAAVEVRSGERSLVRGSVSSRTLAPGGDLLTLTTLAAAPAIALADMRAGLRAQRSTRLELTVEERLGPAVVSAHTFYEDVRDHLGNRFSYEGPTRSLHIFNSGRLTTRGMGVSVGRRFGTVVSGSMSYTYGRGWRPASAGGNELPESAPLNFRQADFHDVVARLETVISGSDTRLAALYRLNTLIPQGNHDATIVSRRFDVQLSQGLPLLRQLTRAEWDLLLAMRNLYYEEGEGTTLDEVAVVNPPTRLLGGIAVRF